MDRLGLQLGGAYGGVPGGQVSQSVRPNPLLRNQVRGQDGYRQAGCDYGVLRLAIRDASRRLRPSIPIVKNPNTIAALTVLFVPNICSPSIKS